LVWRWAFLADLVRGTLILGGREIRYSTGIKSLDI
jgi:hypothetical protein